MKRKTVQETIETCDGLDLFCETYPVDEPQGVAIISHGFGEHCGVYKSLADALQDQNFAVFTYDLRGHGKSPGERGDFGSLGDVVDDLELLVARANERYESKPLFLLGHNIGGSIAAIYTVKTRPHIGGLLLSHLPFHIESSSVQRIIKPLLKVFLPIESEHKAQDFLGAVQANDELLHHQALTMMATVELDEGHHRLQRKGDQLVCPLYVVCKKSHGAEHQRFFDRTLSYSKEIALHDMHPSAPSVFEPMIAWMAKRVPEFESMDEAVEDDDTELSARSF
ncbi:alpha/beta fold hydrolase [Pseudobacteriovorax antillogorgiicola]|nr:alpha/beta fold hydrolase [Pseudobacteriovorax antillogorgiicola]